MAKKKTNKTKPKKNVIDKIRPEEFAKKSIIISKHAHDQWKKRIDMDFSKKEIELFIRESVLQGKFEHYWDRFYIANDVVFIADRKQVQIHSRDHEKQKELAELYEDSKMSHKAIDKYVAHMKEQYGVDYYKTADYYSREQYSQNVTHKRIASAINNINKRQARRQVIGKLTDNYRLKKARERRFYQKLKYGNVVKVRSNKKLLPGVRPQDVHQDERITTDGIVIISVFGSFEDNPCLHSIKSMVFEKNKYGKMLLS